MVVGVVVAVKYIGQPTLSVKAFFHGMGDGGFA
jgi:hypothetical protein